MKILFASSEVVPFAKTGGLADVAGSLPKALEHLGHDVRVIMPRYKKVPSQKIVLSGLEIMIGDRKMLVNIMEGKMPGSEVIVYFVDNEEYFGSRDELYMVAGKDYADNLERFSLFCQAALEFIKKSGWQPDVVHLNDWQTALMAAYLKTLYRDDPFFKKTAVVYTIHNMAYHGLFPKEKLPVTGLGWEQFTPEKMEFWGNIALSKAGLIYADIISTVSAAYAKEIQTEEYGSGLDGLLRHRSKDVVGIVNGLDYDIWNPATDKMIPKRFSSSTISLKVNNKVELQKTAKLPVKKEVPVIGMITRLADQKGFDILAGALEEIMQIKCQFIVLGTGDPKYHELLTKEKSKYPDNLGISLKYDGMLAQLIYAGSDFFIMPSKYEPCGLGQLISFKYGTVPIVRQTGGLADTVHDFNPKTGQGDGFVFSEYSSVALLNAVSRALNVFQDKIVWYRLVAKVMELDYSWDVSARAYVDLYSKAKARALDFKKVKD